MARIYNPGDLVACYISNTEVYEELLSWGIVVEVSETLKDVLVLEHNGELNWFPSRRWRPLTEEEIREKEITGILA